jgi:hypothetical protein
VLNKKGATYISLLVIFFMLSGTVWNLFYFIKNYNDQRKILAENEDIFYFSNYFGKESIFREDFFREEIINDVVYKIWRNEEGSLVKTIVHAEKAGITAMKQRGINFYRKRKIWMMIYDSRAQPLLKYWHQQ